MIYTWWPGWGFHIYVKLLESKHGEQDFLPRHDSGSVNYLNMGKMKWFSKPQGCPKNGARKTC